MLKLVCYFLMAISIVACSVENQGIKPEVLELGVPSRVDLDLRYQKVYVPTVTPYPISVEAHTSAVRGNRLWVHSDAKLYFSEDAGRHWSILSRPSNSAIAGLRLSQDGRKVLLLTEAGEIQESTDGGKHWLTTDLRAVFKKMTPRDRYSDKDRPVRKAHISDDFSHFALVVNCQLLISYDKAQTWRNFAPAKSYKQSTRDYCVEDFMLDASFTPSYTSASMTGSFYSGDYVMKSVAGQWYEYCGLDLLLIVGPIPNCADLNDTNDIEPLFRFSEQSLSVDIFKDWSSVIFEQRTGPIDRDELEFLDAGLFDKRSSRAWWIGHDGVAYSVDQGNSWEPMIGGIDESRKSVRLGETRYLSITTGLGPARGKLYTSEDNHVWKKEKDSRFFYDILASSKGAILAHDGLSLINQDGLEFVKVESDSSLELTRVGDVIWGVGDTSLYVSLDDGENWQTVMVNEAGSTHWDCSEACIGLGGDRRLITVNIVNGQATVRRSVPFSDNLEERSVRFWADQSSKDTVLLSYSDDQTQLRFLQGGAHYWEQLNLGESEIAEVLFAGHSNLVISSERGVSVFNTKTKHLKTFVFAGNIYESTLCSLAEGIIAVDIDLEGLDENTSLVYSRDQGESWFSSRSGVQCE